MQYFKGRNANIRVSATMNDLKAFRWSYAKDKSLIEITNSLSFGVDQFIASLDSGSVTVEGYMTDTFLSLINAGNLEQGEEVEVDLWFNESGTLGFEDVPMIIEAYTFDVDINEASTYTLTLLRSEPKI
jgi:hypothetical protein